MCGISCGDPIIKVHVLRSTLCGTYGKCGALGSTIGSTVSCY